MLDMLKNAGYRKFLIDLLARKSKHPYLEGNGSSNYPVVRLPVTQHNPIPMDMKGEIHPSHFTTKCIDVTPQCLLEAVCGLVIELQKRDTALERIVNLALQSQHQPDAMRSLMGIATSYRNRNYGRH